MAYVSQLFRQSQQLAPFAHLDDMCSRRVDAFATSRPHESIDPQATKGQCAWPPLYDCAIVAAREPLPAPQDSHRHSSQYPPSLTATSERCSEHTDLLAPRLCKREHRHLP
jgi:hypothetical protein